jgi:hypothetical protein
VRRYVNVIVDQSGVVIVVVVVVVVVVGKSWR